MARRGTYYDSAAADIIPAPGVLIEDMHEQAEIMRNLAEALPEIGAANASPGWYGYSSVTFNVDKKLNDPNHPKPFQHPEKIINTVRVFAELGYEPVRKIIQGKPEDMRVGWQPLYMNPTKLHPAAAMMMFWEPHIGVDMPIALYRTATEPKHKNDYREGINEVLELTGKEIKDSYIRMRRVLGTAGIFLSNQGTARALNRIFEIRDDAWVNYERLMAASGNPEQQDNIMKEVNNRVVDNTFMTRTFGNLGLKFLSEPQNGFMLPKTV